MSFDDKDLVDAMTMGLFFGAVNALPPRATDIEVEYIPPGPKPVPAPRRLAAPGTPEVRPWTPPRYCLPTHKALAAYRAVMHEEER